jgi:hypothetical protein
MSNGGHGGGFKSWVGVSPGHLKQEIEDTFSGCQPGEYYALIVQVQNPITGYKVVKVEAPGSQQ